MTTKKILLIVGGVVIAMGLVVAVFVGAIVGFALYQVGNSAAAAKAQDFLRTSEKLKQDIGEVSDFGSIITGNMNMADGNGEATLHLKVIGAQETVNASVHLVYVNGGDWRVSAANYVNKDGATIELLNPFETNNTFVPLLTA
jgi:archaellum component FlaG (FlaF/FlaG flagellin family)